MTYAEAKEQGGRTLLRFEAKHHLSIVINPVDNVYPVDRGYLTVTVPCFPCPIGMLWYRSLNEVYIDYIHVHFDVQRCGVATAMHDYLRKAYPNAVLKTGESTMEGQAWLKSIGYTPADDGGWELIKYDGQLVFISRVCGSWTDAGNVFVILKMLHCWQAGGSNSVANFETFNDARQWCEERYKEMRNPQVKLPPAARDYVNVNSKGIKIGDHVTSTVWPGEVLIVDNITNTDDGALVHCNNGKRTMGCLINTVEKTDPPQVKPADAQLTPGFSDTSALAATGFVTTFNSAGEDIDFKDYTQPVKPQRLVWITRAGAINPFEWFAKNTAGLGVHPFKGLGVHPFNFLIVKNEDVYRITGNVKLWDDGNGGLTAKFPIIHTTLEAAKAECERQNQIVCARVNAMAGLTSEKPMSGDAYLPKEQIDGLKPAVKLDTANPDQQTILAETLPKMSDNDLAFMLKNAERALMFNPDSVLDAQWHGMVAKEVARRTAIKPKKTPESVVGDDGCCRECGAKQPDGRGVFGTWHKEWCQHTLVKPMSMQWCIKPEEKRRTYGEAIVEKLTEFLDQRIHMWSVNTVAKELEADKAAEILVKEIDETIKALACEV